MINKKQLRRATKNQKKERVLDKHVHAHYNYIQLTMPQKITRGFYILNYTTTNSNCQAVINELNARKRIHGKIIDDLCDSFRTLNKATNKKEQRLRDCASIIQLNENGKIIGANFCKNRYCPICQWRKSRKAFAISYNVQKTVEKTDSLQFLFLTLTLKNMKDLTAGIDHILQSFKRLQDTKRFRKIVRGFIRTLEITYNNESNEWHPHIHAIIAVDHNYFTDTELYTDYEEWRVLWQTVAHVDYLPQCNIKKISEKERENAVAEISKYMVKPLDLELSKETEHIYTSLLKSTFGRRLTSTGGVYRVATKIVQKEYDQQCDKEVIELMKNSSVLYTFKFSGYNYIKTEILRKENETDEKMFQKD